MNPTHDFAIVAAVVLGRLLLPLLIPRYPLPGVLACLVLDGLDQTIFQTFTHLNLGGYQDYDKAFDIYYLGIAYLSTLRNWVNRDAFNTSRFLLYWRLIGVVLFEFSERRWLLLLFPNTFEYFFLFYQLVQTRWDPRKLSRRHVLTAAAAIWIFIKLPQEWWIHIAELDTTDLLKTRLFGAQTDTPWSQAIAHAPLALAAIIGVLGVLAALLWVLVLRRLPPAQHRLRLSGELLPIEADTPGEQRAIVIETRGWLDAALVEKVVLVTLLGLIFAHILPDLRADNLQLAAAVAVIVTLNSWASYLLARVGLGWQSVASQFLVLGAVNAAVATLAYEVIGIGMQFNLANALFLLLLLTLVVTLYEVYRPVYSARFETERGAAQPPPTSPSHTDP